MGKNIAALIGILGLFILLVAIGPFITMIAWSHSMTPVFAIREITWIEALAFNVLGSMISGFMSKSRKKE